MKYDKEELEQLIIVEKLSYAEIGRRYNIADTTVRRNALKLGINLEKRWEAKSPDYVPHNKGKRKTSNCLDCDNEFELKTHYGQKFCNKICEKKFKKDSFYKYYINNQTEFCEVRNMRFIKPHILKEQNNKCIICNNLNEWNNKEIIFILDHTDGDASNNLRENLRLVCPNCDSQLDTYKSKNKNSARKDRYLKKNYEKFYKT